MALNKLEEMVVSIQATFSVTCVGCGISLTEHGVAVVSAAKDFVRLGWVVAVGGLVKCPRCKQPVRSPHPLSH